MDSAKPAPCAVAAAVLCELLASTPEGPTVVPPDVPMSLSALLALPALGVDTTLPKGRSARVFGDGRIVAVPGGGNPSTVFLLTEPAQPRRVQRIVLRATGNSSSTIGMVEDPDAISVNDVLYSHTTFAAGGAGASDHYVSAWPGQTPADQNCYFQETVTLTLDRWCGHLVICCPKGYHASGADAKPLHIVGFGREAALAVCVYPNGQFECVSSEWVPREAVAPLFADPAV